MRCQTHPHFVPNHNGNGEMKTLTTLLPLLVLPFVGATGVHRMPLKKLPRTAAPNSAEEAALLAQKYTGQRYLVGAGGSGRRLAAPPNRDEDLYWTQEVVADGGHPVPLSSQCHSTIAFRRR
jgi:hypothetical protein